jgi:high affinity Mn2+ porin
VLRSSLFLPAPHALRAACFTLAAAAASAWVAEPAARADEPFHFMNLLARQGLHDTSDEDWNVYGQITDIWSAKLGFSARYTDLHGSTNSLLPSAELSFTETATFYFGFRLWRGGEAYMVPELIGERPLSHLAGLGGVIQNFELQKTGSSVPAPYLSRAYLRQTFGLGGGHVEKASDQMQLAEVYDRRRIVLTLGTFSILDFFDKSSVLGDARRGFFNMAFLTYAAYDFAADARGYTAGGIAEVYLDDWALRLGRTAAPKDPNQLPLDFRIYEFYGDQAELEHAHRILGHEGVVRVLGYRNVDDMGRFADAISAYTLDHRKNAASCTAFNYGSTNASAPDLCWVRKSNVKLGIGVSVEQRIVDDLGVFFRGMYSDGQTEVYSYTSTDRSISFGAVARGSVWRRAADTVGLGWAQGWISAVHAAYLNMGGVDGFIGDGKLNQAPEYAIEGFYSLNIGSAAFFSVDYQRIWNPAYNADRGPVNIFGGRLHVEF